MECPVIYDFSAMSKAKVFAGLIDSDSMDDTFKDYCLMFC